MSSAGNLEEKSGDLIQMSVVSTNAMTEIAERILREYEALPDMDRRELAEEFLRRAAFEPHDLPSDEDLVAAADRLFSELDKLEQPQWL
jgi:hypothetical protein